MRVEVGCQASPIGKAVELFNKYAAVVTTVIAAVTGLTLKLNQLREKRNEREDQSRCRSINRTFQKTTLIGWNKKQSGFPLQLVIPVSGSDNQQPKFLMLINWSVLLNRSYYLTKKHWPQ